MNIKLDENLPTRLLPVLRDLGHDVQTVPAEGLVGERDERIWEVAQAEGRLLITQNLDFSDVRRFAPGTHAGLLLVRLRAPGRDALVKKVTFLFETEDVEGWSRCFIVATDRKLRVKTPR